MDRRGPGGVSSRDEDQGSGPTRSQADWEPAERWRKGDSHEFGRLSPALLLVASQCLLDRSMLWLDPRKCQESTGRLKRRVLSLLSQ